MARINRTELYTVSFFPMFNILICTLGVLIFILFSIATLSLGVGKSVSIIAGSGVYGTATKHEKIPHYIEWDGFSLIAHPSLKTVSFGKDLREINTYEDTYSYMGNIIDGTALDEHIRSIKASNGKDYVVLLIRPSGFNTLYEIRGYFEKKDIALGYEPVMQAWKLRIQ